MFAISAERSLFANVEEWTIFKSSYHKFNNIKGVCTRRTASPLSPPSGKGSARSLAAGKGLFPKFLLFLYAEGWRISQGPWPDSVLIYLRIGQLCAWMFEG